ncbi:hypothetical protein M3Y99_01620800 [Aphelenchoides fujianensis]|nr:hypothetical protein M3Y99_01620800 [Aphelenchoides fujianensis]
MVSLRILVRTLKPRRVENVVNVLLALVLVSMLVYFYHNISELEPARLPTEEGHTWATSAIPQHVKPKAGEVRTGPGENGKAVILEGKAKAQAQSDMKKVVHECRREPILQRIKDERTAVVCPIIDFISAETLAYSGDQSVGSVGGFWW